SRSLGSRRAGCRRRRTTGPRSSCSSSGSVTMALMPSTLSDEGRALLALNLVPGLGSKLTSALLERFGSARGALEAAPTELSAIPYLGRRVISGLLAARDGKAVSAELELLD